MKFYFKTRTVNIDITANQVHCCGLSSISVGNVNPREGYTPKEVYQSLYRFLKSGYDPHHGRLRPYGKQLLDMDAYRDLYDFEGVLDNYELRVASFILTDIQPPGLTGQFAQANNLRPKVMGRNPKTGNEIRMYSFRTYTPK